MDILVNKKLVLRTGHILSIRVNMVLLATIIASDCMKLHWNGPGMDHCISLVLSYENKVETG